MNGKRQPKGIPVGGQFAANEHDEAGSSLSGETSLGDLLSGEEFRSVPEAAEARLEEIVNQQGAGWDYVRDLDDESRYSAIDALRTEASETAPDTGDYDVISDAVRRENRTQMRPISVRPSTWDQKGIVELVVPGGNGSTVIQLNRHEMEAWGKALLAHAERMREPNDDKADESVKLSKRLISTSRMPERRKYVTEHREEIVAELEQHREVLAACVERIKERTRWDGLEPGQREAFRKDATEPYASTIERIDAALERLQSKR